MKLNDDKTKFLVMTSEFHQKEDTDPTAIQVDSASIVASLFARNLGVMFDFSCQWRRSKKDLSICLLPFPKSK